MPIIKKILSIFFLILICFSISCHHDKDSSLDLRDRVKRITLDNGITVLLLKRKGAPLFSAEIKVKVGNVEEKKGSHGLAHFFEHMAFKGTDKIGTTDFNKEKEILDEIFKVGTKIVNLHKLGKDPKSYADLIAKRKQLEAEENKYIVKNEFTSIYQRNGGEDLNATTSNDFTTYYISLPANKMELWAYLETSRLKNPVLREFFTEVNVVAEERRMRIDNPPSGQMYEAFVNTAFDKSPYKYAVIGPAEDIQNFTPAVAKTFYNKFYIPSRMVVALVGNFDLKKAESIVRQYFSTIPAKNDPVLNFTKEDFDPATFPRTKIINGKDKPRFYLGYHRPAHPHPDDIVLDVIEDLMCEGRTSRLYNKLVLIDKVASYISCYASIPGARLDSMFTFMGMPLDGHTNQELVNDIKAEIQKLIEQGPTEHELQKVINNIDADFIYPLQSNDGLASQLAYYESLTGDWEYMYEFQKIVHEITPDDIQRVLSKYFNKNFEVSVFYENES